MLHMPADSFFLYIIVQVLQIVGVIAYGIYWYFQDRPTRNAK